MRTKTTASPEAKILHVLSEHKVFEQYRMKGATSLSYRTILRTLKPLEEKNLIKLLRTEPSEKGGKEKKIYAITLKGLYFYFGFVELTSPEGKKKLSKIAELFPDLLLFFKKWPLFIEAGIQDIMLNYFIVALHSHWIDYVDRLRLYDLHASLKPDISKASLKEYLDSAVLYGALVTPKTKELVKPIYAEDQEIISLIRGIVSKVEAEQIQISEVKSWLREVDR